MKRFLAIFSLIFCLCLVSCGGSDGSDPTEPGENPPSGGASALTFALSESGDYYTVTGPTDLTVSVLDIPSEYNGLPVREIARSAFRGNEEITEIHIPASVTVIGDDAFSECTSLRAFYVASDNAHYTVESSVLYTKSLDTLIQYPIASDIESFVIPAETVSIASRAFSRAEKLKSVTFHSGVTDISKYAFYRCTSLTSLDLSSIEGLVVLNSSVFSGCSSLESVILPETVREIGDFAFYNCSSLRTVDLGQNSDLREIQNSVFLGCNNLAEFLFGGSYYKFTEITNNFITVGEANDRILSVIVPYVGGYITPSGAWTPTGEYAGISYGVWQSEDDYLAGLAPVKWYTATDIISATVGTIDSDGLEYEDPDFIPGYVHFYKDVTTNSEQITVGREQALIINLGGHTLTSKKGIRIGGNDGVYPKASLIIKNGTYRAEMGTQIQARSESRLTFERAVLIDNTNNYMFYGARSKMISFVDCEFYILGEAQFHITSPFRSGGDEYRSVRFISTELHFLSETRSNPLFRIYENKYGQCNWEIIFDKDSEIFGKMPELATLFEARIGDNIEDYEIDFFTVAQRFIFEEGFSFGEGTELPLTYKITAYDRDTFEAKETATLPVGDGIVEIVLNAKCGVDYDVPLDETPDGIPEEGDSDPSSEEN